MMMNPILRNEMKTEGRQFRFYILLMLYVALLGAPVLLIYYNITKDYRIDAGNFIGMYVLLACMQAIILMFVVPALTASCITSERERQTLDILLTTKMSPRSIIWGKLLGAISKVILLIICTMPVYAVVLFLGGIRLSHIVACNAYLMATTFFVASMCIWVSTRVRTSKAANVTAYFIELGFIIGYPIGMAIWVGISGILYNTNNGSLNEKLAVKIMNAMCASPAVGYGHLLGTQLGSGANLVGLFYGRSINTTVPGWLISIGVEAVLSFLFIEAAIRRLDPHRKQHLKRKVLREKIVEDKVG